MNINLDQYKNAKPEEIKPEDLPDTSYIMNDVLEITDLLKKHRNKEIDTNLTENKFKLKLENKFRKLKEDFPTIFDKTVAGTLEIERLRFMLKMQREIKRKKVSSHEASVTVGQELVNNIVKPNLDKK